MYTVSNKTKHTVRHFTLYLPFSIPLSSIFQSYLYLAQRTSPFLSTLSSISLLCEIIIYSFFLSIPTFIQHSCPYFFHHCVSLPSFISISPDFVILLLLILQSLSTLPLLFHYLSPSSIFRPPPPPPFFYFSSPLSPLYFSMSPSLFFHPSLPPLFHLSLSLPSLHHSLSLPPLSVCVSLQSTNRRSSIEWYQHICKFNSSTFFVLSMEFTFYAACSLSYGNECIDVVFLLLNENPLIDAYLY